MPRVPFVRHANVTLKIGPMLGLMLATLIHQVKTPVLIAGLVWVGEPRYVGKRHLSRQRLRDMYRIGITAAGRHRRAVGYAKAPADSSAAPEPLTQPE